MTKGLTRPLLALIMASTITHSLQAQIRLPKILASNMVLQQQQPVPVWGWDAPGKKVTVRFAGQQKSAQTDASGKWTVALDPLKASSQPAEMTIYGTDTVRLSNLLVGEVWLCSGQSNMEYTLKLHSGYVKPARGIDSLPFELEAAHPGIRLFKVDKVLSSPDVTTTGWNESSGAALEAFSAPAFYFGRNIQQALGVPVGIISSSWGGSRIEPWTPAEGYTALPAFAAEAASQPLMIDSVQPGKYFKSMISPMAPFALRGFLWYQGESNCMINDGLRYADKMQALVESWRKAWGNNHLPFYSVEIAPYLYTHRKDKLPHTPETLPEFWEAQTQSLKIPNTDQIVITDLVDHLGDIHPPYKWEVGRRLALLALAKNYGQKNLEYSGPVYKSMKLQKGAAVLTFDHAGGLKSADGQPLTWFTIAGKDGKFQPAKAEIKGNQVIVSCPDVPQPAAVRFGWQETAQPNLVNGAGLPAVPFRTDGKTWVYKKS